MEALEEETYADFVRLDEVDGLEAKQPASLSRQPAMAARRYRLSLSPLDSLQAEFKRYNASEGLGPPLVPVQIRNNLPEEVTPARSLSRKQHFSAFPSNPDTFTSLSDVDELPDAVSDIPDWDFLLQNSHIVEYPRNSDCPSLATGSTISSRNSSTRSARSLKWDGMEPPEKGRCPYPGCGRILRDLPAHLLTHQAERPEKCPVEDCEYHVKGFARPYDRARHTITHFRETMVCGFCPSLATAAEKTFNRCDLFLRHLVVVHEVEQAPTVRKEDPDRSVKESKKPLGGHSVATCGLCSEPFDAQGFYEHLRGCALRQVTRSCTPLQLIQRKQSPHDTLRKDPMDIDIAATDYVAVPIPRTPDYMYGFRNVLRASSKAPHSSTICQSQEHILESKEIAELTASSRCLSLTSSHEDTTKSSDEETDWTEDTGSPESATDAESIRPMLSPVKRQLVERLMLEFHRIYDSMVRMHHGTGAGGSAGHGYYTGSSGSSTYSSSSFVSRKRSLSGGSSPPPEDNGDDSNKRRRPDPKHTAGKQIEPELRFACPYYKRNPGRHQTFTSCRDPGFITVARLKEHLYRRHLLPIQCNRCCSTFSNEPTLREHQRDARGCEIKDQVPLEGFDKDQERKLKSKKRSLVYQSEEDKWKGVYKILFPDDNDVDMPSPYIEYQPCINGSQASEPPNVARFQEFSRLELPRLVRRTLEVTVEEEAQPLEDRLKERLVDIVRECQTQLISLFQSTQSYAEPTTPLALLQLNHKNDTEASPMPQRANTHQEPVTKFSLQSSFQHHPAPSIHQTPFHNFDSSQSHADYMQIPITMPITIQNTTPLPKHECSPLLDPATHTPDSGYDSAVHFTARQQSLPLHDVFAQQQQQQHVSMSFSTPVPNQQDPMPQPQPHLQGPHSLPNRHLQHTHPHHQPQHQHNTTIPSYTSTPASAPAFIDSEYVDLGGYYGLFSNRDAYGIDTAAGAMPADTRSGVNAGINAGPGPGPWGFLDDVTGDGGVRRC